ncbi:MAG: aldehyde ferredoxin oxidoreductase family protein [Candidatus Hodarchaeota archaeon]
MKGYSGKILHVQLPGKFIVDELDEKTAKQWLGGVGLGTKLLYDNFPSDDDPLSPDNPLIFAVGPFAGTAVPTSGKYAVVAKSPLTNMIGYGISSGSFGPALKRAGYDALIITGRSRGRLYLFIDDDEIHFKNATHLIDETTSQTESRIKTELGDDDIKVACIGPAGERFVRYACISNDITRQVGRCGLGAVMGSKNLKAIAVRGTNSIEVAHLKDLMQLNKVIYERCQTKATEKYRNFGTPVNVLNLNAIGALPTRNFQQTTFEHAEAISGERLKKEYLKKVIACNGCAIGCDHIVEVDSGQYQGAVTGLDYETIYALGSCCGVSELPPIIRAAQLCDDLGIDTISTGVTIAFAMEAFEKGLISVDDTEGINLTFGNAEAIIQVIDLIAKREGIGELLGEGSRLVAEEIGKESQNFAMHVKGLELPGYSLRTMKTAALGFSVSTRGGCHLRNAAYSPDASGQVDRFKGDNSRGKIITKVENFYSTFDSLILCKFMRTAIKETDVADLLYYTTDLKLSVEDLYLTGERITNLQKIFNLKQGALRKDDYPPPRVFKDPVPDGMGKGQYLRSEEYELMLDSYYAARNWSKAGIPTVATLKKLDLEFTLKDIENMEG